MNTTRINGHPALEVDYTVVFIRNVMGLSDNTEINLWQVGKRWRNNLEPDVDWFTENDALSAGINYLQKEAAK